MHFNESNIISATGRHHHDDWNNVESDIKSNHSHSTNVPIIEKWNPLEFRIENEVQNPFKFACFSYTVLNYWQHESVSSTSICTERLSRLMDSLLPLDIWIGFSDVKCQVFEMFCIDFILTPHAKLQLLYQ